MPIETKADLIAMSRDWETARFSSFIAPGVYDAEYADALDTSGYTPVFLCAGEYVSTSSAKLYGEDDTDKTVSTGDTLTEITRMNGETHGPFSVRSIQADGTGAVLLVLEEQ